MNLLVNIVTYPALSAILDGTPCMYYLPAIGVNSDKEQYGACNCQHQNHESPEEALVGRMAISVNDDIALHVIVTSGGGLALPCRGFLVVLFFAHAYVLPYKVQYAN